MSVKINKAKRIKDLPPYLFAEIDRRKRAALARGVDLIDLGVGDPDIPTPAAIVEKLAESASKPARSESLGAARYVLTAASAPGPNIWCRNDAGAWIGGM